MRTFFFFLANPSNNNSCYPHLAFWVLGALPDDLRYRRSLLTMQGYNDLLSHLDRGGKRDLRSGETHLRSHSQEVPGRRDFRPTSHSTGAEAGRTSRHKDSGESTGLGVRSQHSFSNTPLTFLVS